MPLSTAMRRALNYATTANKSKRTTSYKSRFQRPTSIVPYNPFRSVLARRKAVGRVGLNFGQRPTTEIKCVDNSTGGVTITPSTTGNFYLLNGIQEGTGFYNRIGRKINMKSLQLVFNLTCTASANQDQPLYLRMMVIYDRQPDGANPAASDVLLSYNNVGSSGTAGVYAFANMNNSDRFLVLADVRHVTPSSNHAGAATADMAGATDYTGNPLCNYNRFIKLRGLETRYQSTSNPAVISDITSGALFMFVIASLDPNCYIIHWNSRLRYYDV